MSEVKVDFSVLFQEYSLIMDCLHKTKDIIERKEYLAEQTLSARQDYFIKLIEDVIQKLDEQAMHSTGYYDMALVKGEMNKAAEVSKEFLEALKNANGAVWLAIKNSA